jgi:hypothetical protein
MKKISSQFKPFICILIICLIGCARRDEDPFESYRSSTPVKLAEGSLSMDSVQWGNCFVSSTKELYQTRPNEMGASLFKCVLSGDEFVDFRVIPFSVEDNCTDVFVSDGGEVMYFSSSRSTGDSTSTGNFEIWTSTRASEGWQLPVKIEIPLSGSKFYPTVTQKGELFFSFFEAGAASADLYYQDLSTGAKPVKLPIGINSEKMEGDPFIARDGSYLIFAAFDRTGSLGKSDLYISFYDNGHWGEAKWMGESINSEGYDGSPFVTKDGHHLIFTSSRGSRDEAVYFNHYIVDFDKKYWMNR